MEQNKNDKDKGGPEDVNWRNVPPDGQQPPPPGGPQGYYYQPAPPGWFYHDGQWYSQPYAPDGTCLVPEDRMLAMLANLLLLTGFVGPLVIYLIKKDESRFVAFHALQALYFWIICFVLTIVTCGLGAIVMVIFAILVGIKANEGKWEKYWLAGDWAMNSVMHLRTQR